MSVPLKFVFAESVDGYLIKPLEYLGWNKARVSFKEETPLKVNPKNHVAIVGNRMIQLTQNDYRLVN